jgi:hypothetical protein
MPAATYPKHRKAVAIAEKDRKAKVQEVPLGSNRGPRVYEMQQHTWLGGTGWPWCVASCITWAEEAGLEIPYRGAGAYDYHRWAERNGYTVPLARAIPGDFVVWNVGAGHMSMLRKAWTGGDVLTIDGNVSNKVDHRARDSSLVRGGTVIRLPEKPVTTPKVRPPVFEVVTSAAGTKVIYVSGARAIGKRLAKFLKKYPGGVVIRRKKVKR